MTTLRTLTEMDRTHCTRSARWDMTSSLSDIQIFWISWYQHRIVQYCITSLSSGIMEEKPNLYTHAFMLCLNVFEKSLWEANSEMHAKPCKICAIPIKPAIRVVFFFLLFVVWQGSVGIYLAFQVGSTVWLTVPAFTEISPPTLPTHDIPDIPTTQWTVIDLFFQFSKWKDVVAVL